MLDKLTKIEHHHFIDLSLLPSDPVVVDAGACVGDTLVNLLELVPDAKVYAIEPNARNFLALCEKYGNGDYQGKVVLMNYALVGKDFPVPTMFTGFIGLPEWGNVTGLNLNTKHPKLENLESYYVNTITLSKLFDDLPYIDYLKMDVEGAEYSIVETMTMEQAEKIGQLSMELHTLPGKEQVVLIDKLEELGFVVGVFDGELYAANV